MLEKRLGRIDGVNTAHVDRRATDRTAPSRPSEPRTYATAEMNTVRGAVLLYPRWVARTRTRRRGRSRLAFSLVRRGVGAADGAGMERRESLPTPASVLASVGVAFA